MSKIFVEYIISEYLNTCVLPSEEILYCKAGSISQINL